MLEGLDDFSVLSADASFKYFMERKERECTRSGPWHFHQETMPYCLGTLGSFAGYAFYWVWINYYFINCIIYYFYL
jgi:hypothetical protein